MLSQIENTFANEIQLMINNGELQLVMDGG